MSPKRRTGILLIVLCSLLWSTAGLFTKLIPWTPLVIAGWRGLLGALLLFTYLKIKGIPIRLHRRTALIGLSVCATSFLYLLAVKLTTAANAIVLQYTAPVFLIVLSTWILKRKYRLFDYIAVVITVCSIAFFFVDQLSAGGTLGNMIAVLDGICMAFVYLSTGEAGEEERLTGIFFGLVLSALIGIPFTALYPTTLTLESIGAVLFLGIFQLGLPYVLFSISLNSCPPLLCSLMSSLEIILNPVWVFLAIGEAPGVYALIGSAAILITVIVWQGLDAKRTSLEL